jgi:CheB methylesterase
MPADSGMAFVLVQHLSPDHQSMLAEILGRVTVMPVVEAEHGMAVDADRVYVIPPDATLALKDRRIQVSRPAPPRESRRPIDTFFSSLAEDQGDNAICVVLAGTGSDGTTGLKMIKENGGLTLAFLGPSEGVSRNGKLFTALNRSHHILQRRDADGVTPGLSLAATALHPPPHLTGATAPPSGIDRIDRNVRQALAKYSPVYLGIDRHHNILRFSGGEAGRYLEPSAGASCSRASSRRPCLRHSRARLIAARNS